MNPLLWAKAAQEAATVLGEAFPPAANYFGDNSHEYRIPLKRLHEDTAQRTGTIPPHARFLLSSHDTMAYFAAAYHLEIRSMASAAGEASAKPSEDLASWISSHNIRLLFREQLADLQTIRQIARPLLLSSDPQIFTLSLASPGTRFAGMSSELEVDRFLPACSYNVDTILARLELR
ncbi:MAG: manganese transporter [Verrucomicrobiales bacterium]|nr:manganese transporter [Verrucomicrobiales bacterium]